MPARRNLRPSEGLASKTVTLTPARASRSAAIRPLGPPPTTTTWGDSGWDMGEDFLDAGANHNPRHPTQGLARSGVSLGFVFNSSGKFRMTSLARPPATSSELSAAYRAAAQRELQRTRTGAVIVGHKVGYTNIGAWQRLGATEPMWGAMYDDTVIQIGRAGGTCSLAPFVGPRIEPEIVLHFGKTPSLQATLEDVLDCVDWMAQGFEIVLTPADGVPPTVPEAISMGGMHGALLVGHPRPVAELGPDLRARLEA